MTNYDLVILYLVLALVTLGLAGLALFFESWAGIPLIILDVAFIAGAIRRWRMRGS